MLGSTMAHSSTALLYLIHFAETAVRLKDRVSIYHLGVRPKCSSVASV